MTAVFCLSALRYRLIALAVAAAGVFCAMHVANSADAPSAKTVLIIDDSDPDSPFSRDLRTQIHSTLDSEVPAGYGTDTEFLNAGHFNERSYDSALQAYIKDKFRARQIGAIISVGSASLEFAVRLRSELRPDLPIVFITFDEAHTRQARPANTTGIIAPKRFQDMVRIARVLVPQAARIALVGTPIQSQPYRRQYIREANELGLRAEVLDLTTLSFGEIASTIANLPDNTVIASIPLFEDTSGHIHNPIEAMRVLAAVANRPIVTDAEYLLAAGAAGAVVLSASDLGRDVGKLVGRIFNGERAAAIPVETRDYTEFTFNAQALAQWNIGEETLRPGSKVLFRDVTMWQRYRWQVLTALAVLLLQSIVITALLLERRRRRGAERDSHQHLLEVTQLDRALTAGAMSSSIAHELNQPLTAIMNNAEAAAMLLESDPLDREELKAIVADIRRDDGRAADIIKHLRMLLRQTELKPESLVLNDVLTDSISLIEGQANESGVKLHTELPADLVPVRADYVHIQQVILNLCLNAIEAMCGVPPEHRLLQVRLRTKDGSNAIVSISDSGPGIPPEKIATIFNPFVTTKPDGTGLGLSIAHTIVTTYGGRIWAESKLGQGAAFHFSLNLIPAANIPAKAA
jgi:signal transduction histidine kinase